MYFDHFWYPNTITAPYDCYATQCFCWGFWYSMATAFLSFSLNWMLRDSSMQLFIPLPIHGEQKKLLKFFGATKKNLRFLRTLHAWHLACQATKQMSEFLVILCLFSCRPWPWPVNTNPKDTSPHWRWGYVRFPFLVGDFGLIPNNRYATLTPKPTLRVVPYQGIWWQPRPKTQHQQHSQLQILHCQLGINLKKKRPRQKSDTQHVSNRFFSSSQQKTVDHDGLQPSSTL